MLIQEPFGLIFSGGARARTHVDSETCRFNLLWGRARGPML